MAERRTEVFAEGAHRNTAAFRSVQQGAGRLGYRPTSVLEPVVSSAVGYAHSDSQRLLPGGQLLPTPNGSSAATYDRRTLLSVI
ncbi:hypothetical protein ACWDTT_16050 [Streptosporangium sandarakinum]